MRDYIAIALIAIAASASAQRIYNADSVYIRDFNPHADGVTDDSATVTTALAYASARGACVQFDGKSYKVTQIQLNPGDCIIGPRFALALYATLPGAIFVGTTGQNTILLPTGSQAEICQNSINGIEFSGGLNAIYANDGGISVYLKGLAFINQSHAAIYAHGFLQDWYLDELSMSGSVYGFYLPDEVGVSGGAAEFDKSSLNNIYVTGETGNGIYISPAVGHNVSLSNVWTTTIVQTCMVLGGGIDAYIITNWNVEECGFLPSGNGVNATTGTISPGSNSLIVASASGITTASTLTIANIAGGGNDFTIGVSNVSGTTITLAGLSTFGATNADVTFYTYDSLQLITNSDGTPNNVECFNCFLDSTSSLSGLKYNIDLSGMNTGGGMFLWQGGDSTERPIYDPNRVLAGTLGVHSWVRKSGSDMQNIADISLWHGTLAQLGKYFVSALPTCASGTEGISAGATDLLAPTFLTSAVGGGSVHAPVYCNGTNWVSY